MKGSSIPVEDIKEACPVCDTPAFVLCWDLGNGEALPHAIHAGRLALSPLLVKQDDGTFKIKDGRN